MSTLPEEDAFTSTNVTTNSTQLSTKTITKTKTKTKTRTKSVSLTSSTTRVPPTPTSPAVKILEDPDRHTKPSPSIVRVTTTITPVGQGTVKKVIITKTKTLTRPSRPTEASSLESESEAATSANVFAPLVPEDASTAADISIFTSIQPTETLADDPELTQRPSPSDVASLADGSDRQVEPLPETTQVRESAAGETVQFMSVEEDEPTTQAPSPTPESTPAEETTNATIEDIDEPSPTEARTPTLKQAQTQFQDASSETTSLSASPTKDGVVPAIFVPLDVTSTPIEGETTAAFRDSEAPTSIALESSSSSTLTLQTSEPGSRSVLTPSSTKASDATIATLLMDTSKPPVALFPPPFTTGVSPNEGLTSAPATTGLVGITGTDQTDGSGDAGGESSNIKVVNDDSSPATPVIIGSVIGSLAGVLVVAAVVFFCWRRRQHSAIKRRRRSTLLTPLSMPGRADDREKYEFDTDSLGPTPRSTKIVAAVSVNAKRISHKISRSLSSAGHSPQLGLPMNNGDAHFMAGFSNHSRNNSASSDPSAPAESGVLGWWSRLRNRSGREQNTARDMMEKGGSFMSRHSDFSDSGFDRDHLPIRMNSQYSSHNRGVSLSASHYGLPSPTRPRRPSDVESLDLNPFSDANSAQRGFMGPVDPFSDNNSIKPPIPARRHPSNYVEVHQGGLSLNGQRGLQPWGLSSPDVPPPSAGSFEAWRDRVRSDPFDLEVEGTQRSNYTNPVPPVSDYAAYIWQPPHFSHAGSTSSKYSSGVSSVGEEAWNRPGPAVRPLRSRDGAEMTVRYDDTQDHDTLAQRSPGIGKAR